MTSPEAEGDSLNEEPLDFLPKVVDDQLPIPEEDGRVYVPEADNWEARIKLGSDKIYCYQKRSGENYFHLIVAGEVYLISGNEKLCLECALRRGVATRDRLYWQHRVKRRPAPPI